MGEKALLINAALLLSGCEEGELKDAGYIIVYSELVLTTLMMVSLLSSNGYMRKFFERMKDSFVIEPLLVGLLMINSFGIALGATGDWRAAGKIGLVSGAIFYPAIRIYKKSLFSGK